MFWGVYRESIAITWDNHPSPHGKIFKEIKRSFSLLNNFKTLLDLTINRKPVNIYLFKVNNRGANQKKMGNLLKVVNLFKFVKNTRTKSIRRSGVFIVNFEHNSHFSWEAGKVISKGQKQSPTIVCKNASLKNLANFLMFL